MAEEMKIILYQHPYNINEIPQIEKFLEPLDVEDGNIGKIIPYVENKKDLRCRLNNIHSPAIDIHWIKDPFRILTKDALQILNNMYVKLLFMMEYKSSKIRNVINYPYNRILSLKQINCYAMNKKKLEKCMNLIEEQDFICIDENEIDQTMSIETMITTLQIFKDSFFKNDSLHITFHRSMNKKIKNWKDYYNEWNEMPKTDWDIMTEDEENFYLENYNPPNYRYIYYDIHENQKESVENLEVKLY
jgi:hypothetical protein